MIMPNVGSLSDAASTAPTTLAPLTPAPALLAAFLNVLATALPRLSPTPAFGKADAGLNNNVLPTARVYLAEEYVQHPAKIEATLQNRLTQTVRAELNVALITPAVVDDDADPLQDFEQARRDVMYALAGVLLPGTLRPLQFVRCTLRQPTKVQPSRAYVRQELSFVTFYRLAMDVR
jgi:hypothetical protein